MSEKPILYLSLVRRGPHLCIEAMVGDDSRIQEGKCSQRNQVGMDLPGVLAETSTPERDIWATREAVDMLMGLPKTYPEGMPYFMQFSAGRVEMWICTAPVSMIRLGDGARWMFDSFRVIDEKDMPR